MKNFETSTGLLSRLWRWVRSFQISGSSERRLKVADTVSLGDKRFVAVVQVDGKNFLLAGGPANIALLAQLNEKDDFGEVLQQTMVAPPEAPAPPVVVVHQVEKPARRRIKRRKPVAAKVPVPAPEPAKLAKRASPVSPAKKAASAAVKKQPALAAKRSSHVAAPAPPRFGGIPPTGDGSRAFERWLGRTVVTPTAQPAPAKSESSRKSTPAPAPAPAAVSAPAPVPAVPIAVGPTTVPVKPVLSEPLTEVRSEKPVVTTVPEPVAHTKIEEYA